MQRADAEEDDVEAARCGELRHHEQQTQHEPVPPENVMWGKYRAISHW